MKIIFLNKTFEENNYIKLPESFENYRLQNLKAQNQSIRYIICKLQKILYKLKQASRA